MFWFASLFLAAGTSEVRLSSFSRVVCSRLNRLDQCSFDRAINGLIVYAVVDVLTDLMVMALPILLLMGIEITMRQKVALASIFTVGFLIIAISITRTVRVVDSLKTYRFEVTILSVTLWSLLEGAVGTLSSFHPNIDEQQQRN
jgi:hypothetical protein